MIYLLFIIKNTVESDQYFFNLPKEQRDELWEQHERSTNETGHKGLLTAYSAWANEETVAWGVMSAPDVAAQVKHTQDLEKIGWFKHFKAFTLLGTPMEEFQPVDFPNPVYKLWMVRNDPAAAANFARLTQEEKDAFWARDRQALERVGGCYQFWCSSTWCSEEYTSWGVNAYPSFEAVQAHGAEMDAMNFSMYLRGKVLLGVPLPPGN